MSFIGYLEQGLLVRDAAKLRKHYFSTKGWRWDILSVLPTDLMYFWWEPSKCVVKVPCPVIVRLNRLFRLPRMWEWFDRTETATGYPNAFRICKASAFIFKYQMRDQIVSTHLFVTGCSSNFSFNPLECMFVFCNQLCIGFWL